MDTTERQRIGDYEVLARLSVGGMAELFLGALPGPGGFRKLVAVKLVLPDVRANDEAVKLFLDEASISAQFNHPNVAQVYELSRDEGSGELYLAMEFLSGPTVRDVLREMRRGGWTVPAPIAARIIHDASLGLHAAHTHTTPGGAPRPVIHRDLSPGNVMVTFEGFVKVIDFGIAHAAGRATRTATGMFRGTLGYSSPEHMRGQTLDGRSDMFCAALLLYSMLTGRHPFERDTAMATAQAIVVDDAPPPPPELGVPPALTGVLMQALARDRDGRPASCRDFARAIAQAIPLPAEHEVGEWVTGRFAKKRELIQSLLKQATAARPDAKALRGTAVALRALGSDDETEAAGTPLPDPGRVSRVRRSLALPVLPAAGGPTLPPPGEGAPPQTLTDPVASPAPPATRLDHSTAAVPGSLPARRVPASVRAPSAVTIVLVAAVVSAVAALLVATVRFDDEPPAPTESPAERRFREAEEKALAGARFALAAGDERQARRILESCLRCPRAQQLLKTLPPEAPARPPQVVPTVPAPTRLRPAPPPRPNVPPFPIEGSGG